MENILNFIIDWKYLFIFIGAVGVFAILDWKILKEKMYALMLQAERLARKAVLNGGQEQEDWVYAKVKVLMPKTITLLGEKKTRLIIKFLFNKAKDYLDDGEFNGSWK